MNTFWEDEIRAFALEYAERHPDYKPQTIRFQGLEMAYSLLNTEKREHDKGEFIACVAACKLAKDPQVRAEMENTLDHRFHDLLMRAIELQNYK